MGIIVAILAIVGIFMVIPLTIFLIVRKILSDRHRERMAMIERGLNPKYKAPAADAARSPQAPAGAEGSNGGMAEDASRQEPSAPYQAPRPADYYQVPRPEDSTVKWMYIFGGAAVGLLIASAVTHWLFAYTLIETKGLGLSIVVLSICVALYLYYVRKNRKNRQGAQRPGEGQEGSRAGERKEPYTEE